MPPDYHPLPVKIDRYLFSEVLRPSLIALAFYSFVFTMNMLFVLIREALQRGSGPAIVLEVLLLAMPKILVLTIPMALLLGILIGMGRLSTDSEIVALRAAGVSYFRMVRPVLALGLLGSAITAATYNVVTPWASGQMEQLKREMLETSDPNREIRSKAFFDAIPGVILYADEVLPQDLTWPLRKVFVYLSRTEAEGPTSFVCGLRGRIEHQADGGRITLVVDRGEIHQTDPLQSESYRRIPFQGAFRQVLLLPDTDPAGRERRKATEEQTLTELLDELRRTSSIPGWRSDPARAFRFRRALTEVHWRFAVPLAALAFSLLAFPLGLINQRGGKASGFAVSMLIVIVYWLALTVGRDLAKDGWIPVWLGAWGADILLFTTAVTLLVLRQRIENLSFLETAQGWIEGLYGRLAAGRRARAMRAFPRPSRGATAGKGTRRSPISIVDRYLARRFLKVFAYVMLSIFILYSVIEMKGLLDPLLEQHLPLTTGLLYLLFFAPGMLKILMPIAAVVAALVTIGNLCRANEDTALKAAGVSVFRISAPLIAVTACLSVTYFLIQDYVAPFTNQRALKIRDTIEGRSTSTTESGTRWTFGKALRMYGYADYDARMRTLQDVTAIDLARDTFTVRRLTWAPRAVWRGGEWVAPEGWERVFKDGLETYTMLSSATIPFLDPPEEFDRQESALWGSGRIAEEMSFLDLRRHVRRMRDRGLDTARLRLSLYEKLAFPAAPMVMVLIGLPFAFRSGRRGALYGLGIALTLVIVYWSSFAVSSALGQEGILPPIVAAFSPNLLFAVAGGYLFLSTRS